LIKNLNILRPQQTSKKLHFICFVFMIIFVLLYNFCIIVVYKCQKFFLYYFFKLTVKKKSFWKIEFKLSLLFCPVGEFSAFFLLLLLLFRLFWKFVTFRCGANNTLVKLHWALGITSFSFYIINIIRRRENKNK